MLNASQHKRHGKAVQEKLAYMKERKSFSSSQACQFFNNPNGSDPLLRMSMLTKISKFFHGWSILE